MVAIAPNIAAILPITAAMTVGLVQTEELSVGVIVTVAGVVTVRLRISSDPKAIVVSPLETWIEVSKSPYPFICSLRTWLPEEMPVRLTGVIPS